MHARAGNQPLRRQRRGEAGFTMVEVLISMLLAAVAIIGILGLYMAETRASSFSRHSTEATVLAQDKIEQLRTQGNAAAVSTTEAGINERGKTTGVFTRTSTEVVGATYASITVVVTWNDDGLVHTVTLRAKRDLP